MKPNLSVVAALVVALALLLPPGGAGAQGDSDPGSGRTVNVELILDVSGSMAQGLDTGETRMDAAKRVLAEMVEAIPDREGVNVGLRVYGQEGDNTEAGRAVSCASSELVAEIEGVDRRRLTGALEALQPTGWSPTALALERAGEDFAEADEGATNAVVLVTDGLETCGGDPCRTAGDLHQGERAVTTHVIGFALTPDEQATLACIAEAGGGQLLGAGSALELSSALFSVLAGVEIEAGTGSIGGNAFPLLPAGEPGELSVIAVGAYNSSTAGAVPFVVRNNTGKDVVGLKVSATARDAGGNPLGAGDALQVNPYSVPAGFAAFGTVDFGGVELPPDAIFEFEAEPTPTGGVGVDAFEDLEIADASVAGDRIVGEVENAGDEAVRGPILLAAVCFDLDGNLLSHDVGTAAVAELQPGAREAFQVTLALVSRGQGQCPAFLVGASGQST